MFFGSYKRTGASSIVLEWMVRVSLTQSLPWNVHLQNHRGSRVSMSSFWVQPSARRFVRRLLFSLIWIWQLPSFIVENDPAICFRRAVYSVLSPSAGCKTTTGSNSLSMPTGKLQRLLRLYHACSCEALLMILLLAMVG